ncbi:MULTISPECIES: LuxR family transcriptional regulator [Burkholderia]|uniref:LuxR family transcriptional regulator n=1 Tax=Burkholderia TaxID=32008 RepID=UPI000B00F61C|nr:MULTISPECIES: LuxR family transcriptional regulator [Burkholderia]
MSRILQREYRTDASDGAGSSSRKSIGPPTLSIAIPESRDIRSLTESFSQAALQIGYRHHAIVELSDALRPASIHIIALQYPSAWIEHYSRNDYVNIDPVHQAAFRYSTPFAWSDLATSNSREQHVLIEAEDAGLDNGISIPLHQPHGRVLLISLCGAAPTHDADSKWRNAYLLSMQFHLQFQSMRMRSPIPPSVHLTDREQLCLTWVARGKSSWVIANMLDISKYTVDFHIENAMAKLNTRSRTFAAVKATRQGLIFP